VCRLINNQREDYRFVFNGVLTAESKQDEVFERVCRPSVEVFMEGINCTVFAYGQTGSGKTFTITGGPERYAGTPSYLVYHLHSLCHHIHTMFWQQLLTNGCTVDTGTAVVEGAGWWTFGMFMCLSWGQVAWGAMLRLCVVTVEAAQRDRAHQQLG
jgi:hypothetical protein